MSFTLATPNERGLRERTCRKHGVCNPSCFKSAIGPYCKQYKCTILPDYNRKTLILTRFQSVFGHHHPSFLRKRLGQGQKMSKKRSTQYKSTAYNKDPYLNNTRPHLTSSIRNTNQPDGTNAACGNKVNCKVQVALYHLLVQGIISTCF